MARPLWKGAQSLLGEAKTSTVVLLDNSYSMAYEADRPGAEADGAGDLLFEGLTRIDAQSLRQPQLAADATEVLDVVEQRVDQRPVAVAATRMNDQSRRFVDHDHSIVFVEHARLA